MSCGRSIGSRWILRSRRNDITVSHITNGNLEWQVLFAKLVYWDPP